nr:MAG TPA: endosialidase chaperone [Caudoviricetes sp.]
MISGKNKDLYYTSSIDKQLNIEVVGTKIVIDNSMRERDTFTLTESLNDGSELKFGSCLPNQISFIAHDMPAGLIGKTLRPVESLEGNENDPFTYGEYKIFSAVPTADRTKRQVTAYDAMYDILNADVKAWYAGLSFPMTLKQFRNSFFAHLGIAQEETTLVNDSMTVNETLVASASDGSSVTAEVTISGKIIIEAICEINGAFGNMNRAGKFEYVILPSITSALYPADDLYPREDLFPSDANTESMTGHYITFDYEDFQSQAITQLEIRADDNTAGAIVGKTGNTYVISGNFLVSDKTGAELEQIANNVLPIMAQAAYTPIKSCTTVGNPCLELGDPIRFNTSREIVETYLLQRTLTGVQSKRDSIVAQGTEKHSAKVNSIRDTIDNVQRRTNRLERTADHTLSEISDLDERTNSRFEQTADAIQTEVINRQKADTEMSTRISQTAHSIGITATGVEKTVGIVIQLYDENGNIIDTSSDNANIQITGVVTFNDLAQSGSTTINGDNITTGTIRGTNSEFTNVKFLENVYYRYKWGGQLYDYPIFSVDQLGILEFGGDDMHTNYHGSVLFNDRFGRVYIGSADQAHRVACIGDIPNTSGFITGIRVNASGQSGTSGYTKNYFLRVNSSGTYSSVSASQIHVSDRRLKTDITEAQDISSVYMRFVPVHFRYKEDVDGVDAHWHYGFIAQDVKQAFIDSGIDSDNEALVGLDVEDDTWLLDKDELHAMHVQMIQKQQKEIRQLKFDNFSLRGEVDILKQRLGIMEEMLNVIYSKIN